MVLNDYTVTKEMKPLRQVDAGQDPTPHAAQRLRWASEPQKPDA